MSEMQPVVVWLVVLVLVLQLAEFGLRLARGAATRLRLARPGGGRGRFAAMTPLQKIETFRLGELEPAALQLFFDATLIPSEERHRLEALLGVGRATAAGPRPVTAPSIALAPPSPLASVERLPAPAVRTPPQPKPDRELTAR
jgi:hypothetical protein